jgi:hypothetical protein
MPSGPIDLLPSSFDNLSSILNGSIIILLHKNGGSEQEGMLSQSSVQRQQHLVQQIYYQLILSYVLEIHFNFRETRDHFEAQSYRDRWSPCDGRGVDISTRRAHKKCMNEVLVPSSMQEIRQDESGIALVTSTEGVVLGPLSEPRSSNKPINKKIKKKEKIIEENLISRAATKAAGKALRIKGWA